MNLSHSSSAYLLLIGCAVLSGDAAVLAQKTVINRPEFGAYHALWRITHDPVVDDHANYHQHQCWSHDGRYLAYRHCPVIASPQSGQPYAGYPEPTVRVFDLLKNEDRELGLGIVMLPGASWANHHNWLFHVQLEKEDRGFAPNEGAPVIWTDLDTGKSVKIGDGMDQLGGVDWKDEWLYGGIKDTTRQPPFRTARVRIAANGGGAQELKDAAGFQWVVNPQHPVFFTRQNNWGKPFGPTVHWWDLDGRNRRDGMLVLEAAHMAWQGNGEHFIIGDGLPRGRRWDEPAPSNVHILAAGTVGNLSACGHSGRFLVGDSAMFDLRSGDTWPFRHLLSPDLRPTKDFYPIFDGEAKGSPDGTKVAFTVRYDMEKGAVTELVGPLRAGEPSLHVKSTEGFPSSGAVVIWTEIIGYQSKTPTSFEGLTRGRHGTRTMDGATAGRAVTDFTHHLLTDDAWKKVAAVGNEIRQAITDINSPLLRQRGRDVYVAVVRKPDRPWLRASGTTVQLIPGESHYETAGYHLNLNGRRITTRLIRADERLPLRSPGRYAAVAVEWSGLESELGNELNVTAAATLELLSEAPPDFAWTTDRWLVGERETSPALAEKADEAVCEIVHRHDGVIAREWHTKGQMIRRHDLNQQGKGIRRLAYESGRLVTRDYFNRDDQHVSRQVFAPDGFITETISLGVNNGRSIENDHWWFEKGTPVRRVSFRTETVKEGDDWKSSPRKP